MYKELEIEIETGSNWRVQELQRQRVRGFFLCSIFIACPMRRSYKPLCASFNLPLQCHCLQGITQFCRAKTFITLSKLLAKFTGQR